MAKGNDNDTPSTLSVDAPKDSVEQFGWLPCQLSIEIPMVKVAVGNLLRLDKGSIIKTDRPSSSDIPLRINGLLVGWTEFEITGKRLAVRITELA